MRQDVPCFASILMRRAITTDVIVGFPGETEEEFETTKEYVDHIGFYEMHIFKYSKRKGTKAAVMPDQVDEKIKTRRSDILLTLEDAMSHAYRQSYVGREVEVLFETPWGVGWQILLYRIYERIHPRGLSDK